MTKKPDRGGLAHAAITMIATLLVTALLLLVAARLYEREELIFGS